MRRYRNYRKPYHRRPRYYRSRQYTSKPIKGIFAIGVAFILLSSVSSIVDGDFLKLFSLLFVWILGLVLVVLIIRKISSGRAESLVDARTRVDESGHAVPADVLNPEKFLNSEKHGCRCFVDGLDDSEREVVHVLSEGLSYKDYFIFNNLIIPSSINGSSQIDHLVVSKFGIFVVESKDYKDWIFGDKNQDMWTQSLPGGKNKFTFQNPIHQNWSHIKSLQVLFPLVDDNLFQSLVVFSRACDLKNAPIEGVYYSDEVVDKILKFTEPKLSEENIYVILGKLSHLCQVSEISPEQHIENLQLHHGEKNS